MKRVINPRLLLAAAVGIAVLAFAATALGGSSSSTGDSATGSKNASVSVRDDFFSPRSVSVTRGGKVTWRWRGSNPHNVKFRRVPSGASRRGSKTQSSGRFARSFTRRGTYRYVCTIHDGMRGTVKAG